MLLCTVRRTSEAQKSEARARRAGYGCFLLGLTARSVRFFVNLGLGLVFMVR